MTDLIPPDLARCQAEVPSGHTFMTLGGKPGRVRCSNAPAFIATESKPGPDGLVGSMSLCVECRPAMIKMLGADYATFEEIGRP